MATVLERAKLHFAPSRGTMREIHVPEWGDESDDGIFYATALNLSERQRIDRISKGDGFELGIEVILLKLTDKHGNPVFSRKEKPDLMRSVDPEILGRVAADILGNANMETAEKN
jgi:hypothetical protein